MFDFLSVLHESFRRRLRDLLGRGFINWHLNVALQLMWKFSVSLMLGGIKPRQPAIGYTSAQIVNSGLFITVATYSLLQWGAYGCFVKAETRAGLSMPHEYSSLF